MSRGFPLLLFMALRVLGQRGSLDPAFEKIPFDRWLGEADRGHSTRSAGIQRAEMSFHQRLTGTILVKLDGKYLESHRGEGKLVFFVQITDSDGKRYQSDGSMELNKLAENIKAANLEYSQRAFFLPGDYQLAVAILYTASGEHSSKQIQFRVAPPQHALPGDAWRLLPAVEFLGNEETPDSWFLPEIRGRLQWAATVATPVPINVILNVAPPLPMPGPRRSHSGDLAALLPTLKAISQTGSSSISEHISLLDSARRRAVFHQDDVHDLDWPRLKKGLGDASTASIDIHSLSERHHDAQFFVSEVRRMLRASENAGVLIVLTTPVAFESGEDLEPISLEGLPPCRVFYIRYRAPAETLRPLGPQIGERGSRMDGRMMHNRLGPDVVDQLAATLKPLSPRIFDVDTPTQITKILGEIEKALLMPEGQTSR